ncbi:hypothetical protein GCM10007935_07100 [Hydrogenophaga electricum]|uniref:Uncharacterized protein n=1 Tax=Hydrogenophaga electricum TaxID=1230953 RepID=A0ABQ6C4L6_9BURK|nr:hypothetical protein GCM10007935_07100 [Hydrogenophaga electricum]
MHDGRGQVQFFKVHWQLGRPSRALGGIGHFRRRAAVQNGQMRFVVSAAALGGATTTACALVPGRLEDPTGVIVARLGPSGPARVFFGLYTALLDHRIDRLPAENLPP